MKIGSAAGRRSNVPGESTFRRADDYITRHRWIIIPILAIATLTFFCRFAWRFVESKLVEQYVADQIVVAGDPDYIDEVIARALPGAREVKSIAALRPSDCDCDGSEAPSPTAVFPDAVTLETTILGEEEEVAPESILGAAILATPVSVTPQSAELAGSDSEPIDQRLNFAVRLLDVSAVDFGPRSRLAGSTRRIRHSLGAVYSTVADMNLGRRAMAEPVVVVADPNFILRSGQTQSLADKFKMDPKDPPGGIGPGAVGSPTAQALFRQQWALADVPTPGPGGAGSGVEIVVFDTSPFSEGLHAINWAATPFSLDVRSGYDLPTPSSSATEHTLVALKQHGLSVASIANAVAPEADLILYHVLNDEGDGTLYSVLESIYDYLDQATKAGTPAVLATPAVLNLSLGIRCIEIEDVGPTEAAQVEALATTIATAYPGLATTLVSEPCPITSESVQPNIPTLYAALGLAHALGASVVAASGNDSGEVIESSQLPALYDTVISVAGTTNDPLTRACFSNAGQVAAPAGGAGATPIAVGTACPMGLASVCTDANATPGTPPVGCDDALIGVVNPASFQELQNAQEFASGHAFWMGTSFAAPIVAGYTARIMESNTAVVTDPDAAAQQLNCGTAGGDGVPQSLPAVDVGVPLGSGSIDLDLALDQACQP